MGGQLGLESEELDGRDGRKSRADDAKPGLQIQDRFYT